MNLLHQIAAVAQADPQKTAVLEDGQPTTYGELLAVACAAGKMLPTVTQADAVGIYLPTSLGFTISFLGVLAAGKTVVSLNILLSPGEIEPIVADSGCDLIIGTRFFEEILEKLPCTIIYLEDVVGGIRSMAAAGPPELPDSLPGDDDVAVLLYTSGTTGAPKGVELTHRNLISNCDGCRVLAGFRADDVMMAMLPMFHSFALTATMLLPLTTGAVVVPLKRFTPELALQTIEEARVTVLLAIPSMYRLMVRAQAAHQRDVSSMRVAIAGGEGLPQEVKRSFEEACGITLLEGYGLTESSPVISFNPPGADRPGTVGIALPDVETRIAEDGELLVKGPNVMRGYRNKPGDTAAAITPDGWLMTGDMASIDDDGYISIVGRKKEMIIVGGENVFPAEVENALSSHPAVFEVAVIGKPDQRRGEQVAAYVVLAEGEEAVDNELKEWCRERLAPYKVPRFVEFRDSLPKSPTGKVMRRAIKESESG